MIIDDSEMMRVFLSHYFKKNYNVSTFNTGMEALEEIDRGMVPDIILLDLNMPGMSGHEMLTHIKTSVLNQDIRVIILSGMTETSDRIRCLEAGADDFVTKPFNPKELELRLLKHVRQFSEG